jgi:hypothetical protein
MGIRSKFEPINLVESVGLIALILSLIFVGLEVRQNTIATRAAAYQEHGAHIANQFLAGALDDSFARIWIVGEDGWEQLSETDKTRLLFANLTTFRN